MNVAKLFWNRWIIVTIISILAGTSVGMYTGSLILGFATYFVLSFILSGLVVYASYKVTLQGSDNS
jgi:hypothetical protein